MSFKPVSGLNREMLQIKKTFEDKAYDLLESVKKV